MKVGFLGLGHMGKAIAANLLKAGHELTVWNRSPEKAKDLVERGARLARTPAEAAQGDVVMSMLADDHAVESVVYGENGILHAPAVHISHSTISLALVERLTKDQGPRAGFLAAPVFGRPAAAEAAKLFVVTAGNPELIERFTPLFSAMGQRTFRVGTTPSAASAVKISGNYMIMAAVEAMAEAMTLVETAGVSPAAMLAVLTGTIFNAPVYQIYGDILVKEQFRPAGFAAPLGLKDMNLVDAAATAARVPMPILSVVRDQLRATIASEGADVDWAGIALAVRKAAGKG